ncbi:PAS domain S-box protein [Bordetella sp. H567]|uniref:PAS domain S-box protein n=1 Tax=Bordetella sp. H567 TaxID=1697043 RepID=UPI0009F74662|nr:PAS domain S-box protein [Bordetella sp. H567]
MNEVSRERHMRRMSTDRVARALLESATDFAIFTLDLSLRITSWNTGACKVFGWTEDEALGADAAMIFTPESRERGDHLMEAETARTQGRAEDERWHLRKDGSRLWASGLMQRFVDERTRQHIGYLKIVRDRTEQHLAESRARAVDARFRALVEGSPQMTFFTDASGRVIYTSPYWQRYTGRDHPGEQRGDWTESIHPDDRKPVQQAWRDAMAKGIGCEMEIRFLCAADSTWRWFMARAAPIEEEGYISGWLIIAFDIDLVVAARNDLRRSQRLLLNEVARGKAERDRTWQLANDLMVVTDFDGYVLDANPAWTDRLGWKHEELLGNNILGLMHGDYASLAQSQLKRLQRGHATSRFVCECRHRDGSFRTLSWTAVPGDGLVHAVAQDVTAENEATAELELAQEALRQSQKMEAVGQLTGGIAHDFNNLLTGIIGALQLMQKRAERGMLVDVTRYTDMAMESAKRAAALTHRLLAFSRRQPLAPKPTQPTQLIRSLTELFERTLGERIALEVDLQDGLWNVLCDPHQLENAILNLVINARDAMPDGGTLTITARNVDLDNIAVARAVILTAGEYVCLCVADTGVGMPPDVAAKAFEPFFSTKPQGEGTGLGLSMVYGFVRQSGGYTELDSRPGEGTSIRMYLPRYAGPVTEEPDADTSQELPAVPAPTQQPLVLVVEDDPRVRDLLVEVLQDLRCRVVEAADGLSGLRILKDTPSIRLVISDIGLPGMDGRRMVEEARVHHPGLKVILVTGYAQSLALTEGLRDPGMELVTKPFGIDEITRRITAVLAA